VEDISDVEAQQLAHELVVQDSKENLDKHGQNVRERLSSWRRIHGVSNWAGVVFMFGGLPE